MSKRYLVFRVYTSKERPNIQDRTRFYGWTHHKEVVEVFLSQRNKKKYQVRKMHTEDLEQLKEPLYDDDESNVYIDYVLLKSAKTEKEIPFFITSDELKEAEVRIHRMMQDMARLSNIPGDGNYLELYVNLKEKYKNALYFIGYRPEEIDTLFPSISDETDGMILEEKIDDSYAYGLTSHSSPPGYQVLPDIASKTIYSLESFIKVLKEDL